MCWTGSSSHPLVLKSNKVLSLSQWRPMQPNTQHSQAVSAGVQTVCPTLNRSEMTAPLEPKPPLKFKSLLHSLWLPVGPPFLQWFLNARSYEDPYSLLSRYIVVMVDLPLPLHPNKWTKVAPSAKHSTLLSSHHSLTNITLLNYI